MPLVAELELQGYAEVFEKGLDDGVVVLDGLLGVAAVPHAGQELPGGIG